MNGRIPKEAVFAQSKDYQYLYGTEENKEEAQSG
jgi:hypothetical protein